MSSASRRTSRSSTTARRWRRPRTMPWCAPCGTPTPVSPVTRPGWAACPGATDGTVITSRTGMPSVVYGPGGKWIAHQADEFVEIDDLRHPRQRLRRGRRPLPAPPRLAAREARTAQRRHRRRRRRRRALRPPRPGLAHRHHGRGAAAWHRRRRRRARRRAWHARDGPAAAAEHGQPRRCDLSDRRQRLRSRRGRRRDGLARVAAARLPDRHRAGPRRADRADGRDLRPPCRRRLLQAARRRVRPSSGRRGADATRAPGHGRGRYRRPCRGAEGRRRLGQRRARQRCHGRRARRAEQRRQPGRIR